MDTINYRGDIPQIELKNTIKKTLFDKVLLLTGSAKRNFSLAIDKIKSDYDINFNTKNSNTVRWNGKSIWVIRPSFWNNNNQYSNSWTDIRNKNISQNERPLFWNRQEIFWNFKNDNDIKNPISMSNNRPDFWDNQWYNSNHEIKTEHSERLKRKNMVKSWILYSLGIWLIWYRLYKFIKR